MLVPLHTKMMVRLRDIVHIVEEEFHGRRSALIGCGE
jgi:hypothetical protein